MLATHKRNLNRGCWGITELEYSPINCDVVESGFGHLNLFIQSLHGTPIQGCIGPAHAAALKAFATAGGKRQAAKAAARTTGAGALDEAVIQAKLAAWESMIFFKLPMGGVLDAHQGHPAQVRDRCRGRGPCQRGS